MSNAPVELKRLVIWLTPEQKDKLRRAALDQRADSKGWPEEVRAGSGNVNSSTIIRKLISENL